MASMQKTMIIGNVGKPPELRNFNGKPVCNFSVACTEKWKDGNGERKEETTWYNVSAWGELANVAQKYVTKGMSVHVEGKVKARAYKNSAGEPASSLDLTAASILFLSSSGGNSNAGESAQQHPIPPVTQPGLGQPEWDDLPADFADMDF